MWDDGSDMVWDLVGSGEILGPFGVSRPGIWWGGVRILGVRGSDRDLGSGVVVLQPSI